MLAEAAETVQPVTRPQPDAPSGAAPVEAAQDSSETFRWLEAAAFMAAAAADKAAQWAATNRAPQFFLEPQGATQVCT